MIQDKTLTALREHYNLDELRATRDFDKECKSPCGKYTAYQYEIYVRQGDLRFTFYMPVHWKATEHKAPWWNIFEILFFGRTYSTYSQDYQLDSEYVMNMILLGLEGDEDEQRD